VKLTYRVIVERGIDSGRELTVGARDPDPIFVGTSPAANLRLTDPLVSRRHLAITRDGGVFRVNDLASTNGTKIAGVRIVEGYVENGLRVEVGDTVLAFEVGRAEAVALPPSTSFGRVLGASPEMRALHSYLAKVALSNVPVIIEGETGTGKEVVAEAIHEAGPRAREPFVVFDCTVATSTLLEAALFGHERGAFTGAVGARPGVFEAAHKGTLLIDEIGDLDAALQAKLLRAVETGRVQRIGSNHWIQVDVRLIAATRRDLEREIQAGRFRDDLYYRLAVARVELPPLRRRAGDITLLSTELWKTLGGAGTPPQALLDRFEAYSWPGNVRELRNAVARAVALGEEPGGAHDSIFPAASAANPADRSSSGDPIDEAISAKLPFLRARDHVMRAFLDRYLSWVLEQHGNNVSRAAAGAGIARRYFYTLMNKGDEPRGRR